MLKRIVLLIAGAGLLYQSASCSVVYSGCEKDSECTPPEVCIIPSNESSGECGIAESGCLPGETTSCEPEALADPNDPTTARGECAGKMQVCDEATGTFVECREAEVCDGLDNNCDGVVDDGVGNVGMPCEVGQGVCLAEGQIICTADGDEVCDATAGMAEPSACDCRDNNCEGAVDEFTLTSPELTVGSNAPQTNWDIGVSPAGRRFAAYEDMGTGEVVVYDLDNSVEVGRNLGSDPMLVSGEQGMIGFFYIADGEVPIVPAPPEPVIIPQLHFRLLDPVNATLTGETCLSCEEGNEPTQPVIEYDAVYGLCLDETTESCAWQTVYVRDSGLAATGRVNETSMMIETGSVGPIIATGFTQIIDAKIAMSKPDEAYIAVALNAGDMAYSIALIWARLTNNNRLQSNPPENTVQTGLSGDPVFDVTTVDFVDPETNQETVNFLLLWADASGVNGVVQTRRFEPVNGPTVFSNTAGTYTDLNIEEVCPRNAFVFWGFEPETSPGTRMVGGVTINKGVPGDTFKVDQRSNEISGALPRASVGDNELVWGALVADGAADVTPTTPVMPAVAEVACDP